MTCKTRYLFDEFRRHFLIKLAPTLCQSPWPFWFKVGDHFDSKLVAILVSTYDTNSDQESWGLLNVTNALFTRTLGLFVKYRFLFGSKIWFGAKICHQLEQKFATNLDKNLPPTWTKAGHHLDTQLTKNDTLCPAEAYLLNRALGASPLRSHACCLGLAGHKVSFLFVVFLTGHFFHLKKNDSRENIKKKKVRHACTSMKSHAFVVTIEFCKVKKPNIQKLQNLNF